LISCRNIYDQVWRKKIERQAHFEKAKFLINNFDNKMLKAFSRNENLGCDSIRKKFLISIKINLT